MANVSFPGNVSFGGTVSSPLFVSTQQILAPFAAGTASTLTVGSFASTFSNVSQAYAATLTVGTILNFSAGGTLGTNLILSGSINAVAGSISTLTVGSLATTFLQAATLSASTYLNVVFNQTSSSSGTTSSTYQMGTLAVGGGGSFAGTLAAACFTNQAAPLFTLDVAGGARVTPNLGVGTLPNTNYSPGLLTLGNGANTLELASSYGTSFGSVSHICAFNAANNVRYPICLNGFGGNVGINTTSPQAALDVAGSVRVTGSLTVGGLGVPKIQYGTAAYGSSASSATITFPFAFATVPVVFTQPTPGGNLYIRAISIVSTSTTGFTYTDTYLSNNSSTISYAGGDTLNWLAMGT